VGLDLDSSSLSQNSDPESPDAIINALKPETTRARQALTRQDGLDSQLLRAEATIAKLEVGELWQFSLFFYSSGMAKHPERDSYRPLPPDERARATDVNHVEGKQCALRQLL